MSDQSDAHRGGPVVYGMCAHRDAGLAHVVTEVDWTFPSSTGPEATTRCGMDTNIVKLLFVRPDNVCELCDTNAAQPDPEPDEHPTTTRGRLLELD